MMFLTSNEIQSLTRKSRFRAQARELARMGVRFIVRHDGSPVVTKLALDNAISDDSRRKPDAEPDFSKLDA